MAVEVRAGERDSAQAARRQRPLTIVFPFAGGAVGGSHISAVKLVKGLDRAEFRPLVLLHRSEGPVLDLLAAEGIGFELAPTPEYLDPATGDRLRR